MIKSRCEDVWSHDVEKTLLETQLWLQKRLSVVNLSQSTFNSEGSLKMNFHQRDWLDAHFLPGARRGLYDKACVTLDTIKGNSVQVCAQALVCVFF